MKEKVKIVEVGPRDGLQNEAKLLSVQDRVELIRILIEAGLRFLEGGSFVSPKAIPQMADSEKVWEALKSEKVDLSFLVPNEKGLQRALTAEVKSISVFTAASDSFNQKNIGMTVDESLRVIQSMLVRKKDLKGIKIRGYISTAFGCPYEGFQDPKKTVEVAEKLLKLGCSEVSIGDTIGVAHYSQVQEMLKLLKKKVGLKKIAMHFHDTRGAALTNIKAALDAGIRIFDSSIGGLGGCPYAVGSSGNVATEEVVWLLEGAGFQTGVSIEKLLQASKWIESKIERGLKSKLYLSKPTRLFFGKR